MDFVCVHDRGEAPRVGTGRSVGSTGSGRSRISEDREGKESTLLPLFFLGPSSWLERRTQARLLDKAMAPANSHHSRMSGSRPSGHYDKYSSYLGSWLIFPVSLWREHYTPRKHKDSRVLVWAHSVQSKSQCLQCFSLSCASNKSHHMIWLKYNFKN